MPGWDNRVKIKHLFVTEEDHESIQASMSAIADVLMTSGCFVSFRATIKKFRNIPTGDDFFKPVDYANKLLSALYDFADYNRIWLA